MNFPLAAAGALLIGSGLAMAQDPVVIAPVTEVPAEPVAEAPTEARTIDLAICLDTSGSMSGLIEAAKQKLWAIVNDLALAEPTPRLRVALLTFGNNGHSEEDGWVKIDSGLTEDLDTISQQLFALSTNGGEEYVGRVVHYASTQLDWHPSDDTLKLIVVAGNESADQDQQMPFRDVCRDTIGRGIMINSIYCGDPADNIAPGWREVAKLADGQFASIDHNNGTVVITTPFDDQITELSAAVNETYLPVGEAGEWGRFNQTAQDANAVTLNSAASAARAQTKANALYNCSWDLIDACKMGQLKLEEVKEEDLPENMRSMTMEERRAYIDQMQEKRAGIQKQINDLGQQRQGFIDQRMREGGFDEDNSFDYVIRGAIRSQAETKGFKFKAIPRPLDASKCTALLTIEQDGRSFPGTVDLSQVIYENRDGSPFVSFTIDMASLQCVLQNEEGTWDITAAMKAAEMFNTAEHGTITFTTGEVEAKGEGCFGLEGELMVHGQARNAVLQAGPLVAGRMQGDTAEHLILKGSFSLMEHGVVKLEEVGARHPVDDTVHITLNLLVSE